MPSLSRRLLDSDLVLEKQMFEELWKLQQVKDKIPANIRALLETQGIIDGTIYYNWFLDNLELAVENENWLIIQEELKWIQTLIKIILETKENCIKDQKAKLLEVLFNIDIKELTCPYLGLLWAQICSTWKKIEWYEDLEKNPDSLKKIDVYTKIEKIEEKYPFEKLGFNEIKIKSEIQENVLFLILDLFIQSIDKLTWKEIIKVWNILITLSENISKLADIKVK